MTILELWIKFKEIFIDLVQYIVPIIALILSIISFSDSRKAGKIQERLNEVEEKLKKYELEEKEKAREDAKKAVIEARVVKISKGSYRLKIWNSGKATAYNIDFNLQEGYEGVVRRNKVPYEFLESGKNFEEVVFVHSGTPHKFMITTTWSDESGVSYCKEQIVSI